ncbi:UDP-galactopyranose mutase [Anaerotruncus colihominis]|uniref:UDP-galactopyranose mutase n=1 Tax=Anaerotruncus colihominis DSM 17241 TaxID=445972 RepID=B0PHT2_9FIRM|nr:UDP-galactopyranose mutase [Anaerotruncus colihominis]EDS09050.1 UDP-galactopyranose mutase [Anaerotruncus colihominis DSM 17241]UWN73601.1 UDP-galactopyranose mutase [Anaerotruncus colihominis]
MTLKRYDAIVVGSGFAGAVTARELAEQSGARVLVLEQRPHIGGNAYDCLDAAGVRIHCYGPHIFHTNDERVYRYLSRFTQWLPYSHTVLGNIYGKLVPIPFNLNSIDALFSTEKARRLERRLVEQYGAGSRVSIHTLRQADDPELSDLASFIFENVFARYTEKQWGTPPDAVDPSVLSRVPVLVSRDNRYFQDRFQGIPRDGYTALFERLLDHPGIEVRLSIDARSLLDVSSTGVRFEGAPFNGVVVYTGALDELLGCSLGRLPYRTLDFQFETLPVTWYQPCATVNYTVDEPFTRITEFKYFSAQKIENKTTIVKEFARGYTGGSGEIPYYAVLCEKSASLYTCYLKQIAHLSRFYLIGRLAEYQYYNMDAIVGQALSRSKKILQDLEGSV